MTDLKITLLTGEHITNILVEEILERLHIGH